MNSKVPGGGGNPEDYILQNEVCVLHCTIKKIMLMW